SLPRTDASITSSPIFTATPPIRLASTVTLGLIRLPYFSASVATISSICCSTSGYAERICASSTPSCSLRSCSKSSAISGSTPSRSFSASTRTKLLCSALNWPLASAISCATCSLLSIGLPMSSRALSVSTTVASRRSASDQDGSAFASRARSNAASAYGRAIVNDSAMGSAQLVLQVGQQLGVAVRVDLAAQDALGAGHRQRGHLLAQLLARALRREHRLFLGGLARRGDDLRGLVARVLDDAGGLPLGERTHLGGAGARLLQLLLGTTLGRGEIGLRLVGGGEPLGDALRARVERARDRRPDEARGEPPQRQEDDDLYDERRVQVHDVPPRDWVNGIPGISPGTGWR